MTTTTRRSGSSPRLAVALDTADEGRLIELASTLAGEVDVFKVGLEAVVALGPRAIRHAAQYAPVFCDLKLHDIPNTVAGAAAAAAAHGASMLTVHAGGGSAMVTAAVEAAPAVDILAVTVLTSLDDAMIADLGMQGTGVVVPRLAARAVAAGAAGIVCAGSEVATVRGAVADSAVIVVPGVRPEGAAVLDQTRVVTPRDAVDAGADVLVVGRPVTTADDPVAVARTVRRQMAPERSSKGA